MRYTKIVLLFFFLVAGSCFTCCRGQKTAGAKWAELFDRTFDRQHIATELLWDSIRSLPVEKIREIIGGLDANKNRTGSGEGQIKLALVKIWYCRLTNANYGEFTWQQLGATALQQAALLQNDYLLQSCCALLGDMHLRRNQSDTAIFYLLKSCALAESLGYNKAIVADAKIAASNVLYRTQNYAQCILFCAEGIRSEEALTPIAIVTAYNNMGLGYLKSGYPDSALFFFTKAMNYSRKKAWGVWEGIAAGNVGDALHAKGLDEEAMRYWQKDLDSSRRYEQWENAGLTLAYMSEYYFNHGETQKAIAGLNWAVKINKNDMVNLVRIYKIKAACYRKLRLHDSADWFLDRHYQLNDSINRVVSAQNFNTVQLKLAYEKNEHEYRVLKKQRQTEVIRRNLLLIAFVALLVIGWLLYNRQHLKIKLARQQQAMAESETAYAKEQLSIFTQTLLEKNGQIEMLNASLMQHTIATNDELIHQTLLTDYDWNKFKELFERLHPAFFPSLKRMAPTITQSELRLAALIKLNLDNKQMASMQGISVSSLRGNKTRLRQKLELLPDADLDHLIKSL